MVAENWFYYIIKICFLLAYNQGVKMEKGIITERRMDVIRMLPIVSLIGIASMVLPLSADANQKEKVILKWENPEEGSASGVDSEAEYQTPLLQSPGSESQADEEVEAVIEYNPKVNNIILPSEAYQQSGDEDADNNKNSLPLKAAREAERFLEKYITSVKINGRTYRIDTDCAFFVRAAYWNGSGQTLDLFEEAISSGAVSPNIGSGVKLIAQYFQKKQVYKKKNPEVGDIIIFDDTWDKNKNSKRDDPYTHVGIVTAIEKDGTIVFVHGNAGRKIKKGYINFDHPDQSKLDGRQINSYLRVKYSWEHDSSRNLASHLVRAFVSLK